MQWLQDKKNLPFVIGGVVLVVVAAGVFLFMQISGGNNEPIADQSTGGAPPAATDPALPVDPSGAAPPPVPGTPDMTAPGQMGGAAPSTPAVPGTQMAGVPGGDEAVPTSSPAERWRMDPFAPQKSGRGPAPKPKLYVPMPSVIFPPQAEKPDPVKYYKPQPPRRVAGILYGDKVNALIQTPDGWEIKRAGEKLSDGTVVERIERDRVILRTAGEEPSFVEVRLAASLSQLEPSAPSGSSQGGNRRSPSGASRVNMPPALPGM